MVSVIVPLYNSENYIADALHSILASTYKDIEVICLDDGSTDNSLQVAQAVAREDDRLTVLHRENDGVCTARNEAIDASHGEYILCVDSDDMIYPHFIEKAVELLDADPEVKVVEPKADLFGERTGIWKLKPFNIRLLARKNIFPPSCVFRRTDYERTTGFCKEIIAREDWEFWIQILKDGGKVAYIPEVSFHYRFKHNGKRVSDRKLKRHVVKVLNERHPEFFERQLNGPLRINRTYSRLFNTWMKICHPRKVHVEPGFEKMHDFMATLPYRFLKTATGHVVYKGRNELREFDVNGTKVVVKAFCKPNFINRIAYDLFRKSKARRSCEYAALLRSKGIGSPAPVGYCTERRGPFFTYSYCASLKSELPYTYIDLIEQRIDEPEEYLREVGRTAGRMHEAGMIHRDFSRGNLLLGKVDGKVRVEVVDLNRIRFHAVSIEEGLKNFERLPANDAMKRALAEGYAEVRHADVEQCLAQWPETESMTSKAAGVRG